MLPTKQPHPTGFLVSHGLYYTPFIYYLYNGDGIIIQKFDKKYLFSFMNRNDKDVEHLIIISPGEQKKIRKKTFFHENTCIIQILFVPLHSQRCAVVGNSDTDAAATC